MPKTKRRRTRGLPEITALDRIRVKRQWTWLELSAATERANARIPFRTLHTLLTSNGHTRPHWRTLAKIQKFLKSRHARLRKRKRPAATSRARAGIARG